MKGRALPLCWKGKKPFKSVLDVKKEFKSLVLNFANGKKALMEIPPENYLIVTVSIPQPDRLFCK